MLLGQATEANVIEIETICEAFAGVSGLRINPEKSSIWFSSGCPEEEKERVMQRLGVKLAGEEERYLGVFISSPATQKDLTHELLVQKFHSRLAGWKTNLLSHAGRLALIKSVLGSIPVYYMSLNKIPTHTIKELESPMRKFLWGTLDKDRYLSMVAWSKICMDVDEGGLGIRNLQLFNEALVLKLVWEMASNSEKLWTQVMRAKYCSRGGFWGVKSKRDASELWRNMQDLKHFFRDGIEWKVGEGKQIQAISQLWYQAWEDTQPRTNRQKELMVSDLYDQEAKQWKVDLIAEQMGAHAVELILSTAKEPRGDALVPDMLIWHHSKGGKYTVKEGYVRLKTLRLSTPVYEENKAAALKAIWQWKCIQPKVQLFLWRAIHDGLTTAQALHRRIRGIQPTCPRCGSENEFLMHLLFFCELSRVTWFPSEFALRVHDLPLDFATTLL